MHTNYDNRCSKAGGSGIQKLILNKERTFEAIMLPVLTWFMTHIGAGGKLSIVKM